MQEEEEVNKRRNREDVAIIAGKEDVMKEEVGHVPQMKLLKI